MATIVPTEITQTTPHQIKIVWNDGEEITYSAYDLRLACPCAECVHEVTQEKLLDPKKVPLDIVPVKMDLVGRYGLEFTWSDQHATGIYPFTLLRHLTL